MRSNTHNCPCDGFNSVTRTASNSQNSVHPMIETALVRASTELEKEDSSYIRGVIILCDCLSDWFGSGILKPNQQTGYNRNAAIFKINSTFSKD